MKRVLNYLFYFVNTLLFFVIVLNISLLEFQKDRIGLDQKVLEVDSTELAYHEEQEEDENDDVNEEVVEELPQEVPVYEEVVQEEEVVPPVVTPNITTNVDTTSPALETFVGNMSGYGPDCYGCTSNRTASGYYVGEGNIYYSDPTYGTVRIVSGDRSYPFGTIVRITGYNEPIVAIILDNGGGVGFGKKVQFDLLFAKESDALPLGIQYNLTFEILRYGY